MEGAATIAGLRMGRSRMRPPPRPCLSGLLVPGGSAPHHPGVRFNLFGVPVLVQPLFLIGALFLGLSFFGGQFQPLLVWVPIVFFAVLIHELGHALMGRRFGLDPEIHLLMLGGRTVWASGRRLTPGPSILVSFAGPAIGLVLGGGLLLASPYLPMAHNPLVEAARISFIWTNLGWAIFNLVPIVGLDGGNIMAAIFEKVAGAKGIRWAHLLSVFIAAALATYFLSSGNLFMAFMLGLMAVENYQRWQLAANWTEGMKPQQPGRTVAKPVPLEEKPLEPEIQKAYEALEAENHATVRRIAESLVPRIRTDAQRFDVAHLVAWGRLLTGDPVGAERALRQLLPLGRRPDALLEGSLLLDIGRPDNAVGPLAEALVDRSDDFVASRLARASSAAKDIAPVLSVLKKGTELEPRPFQLIVAELMRDGHLELASQLGEALFSRFNVGTDAFNVACAHARSGKLDEALRWVESALGAGLPNPQVVLDDEDLKSVRERPEFEPLRERVIGAVRPN